MKKLFAIVFAAITAAAFFTAATPEPVQAQPAWCAHCCDVNPYTGGPRIRCTLVEAWPCGGACACAGIAGAGFACF